VTVFYDIDTPVTLARLHDGIDYLAARQIPRYDLYLSFTGGPILERLERRFGARRARALYCSVNTDLYFPEADGSSAVGADLGYLGTYSADRQPVLERLLLTPARLWPRGRFVVAGPQYPPGTRWPPNVRRLTHLEPKLHRRFYTSLRFTLNITRRDMVAAGYSPSVRLFEAAACGTPIVSDSWPGLETFFKPDTELLLARDGSDTLRWLRELPEEERVAVGARARKRVLQAHTATHRAAEFEALVQEARGAIDSVAPAKFPAEATPAEGAP
jgi:spore maturation protein CgeB